MLVRMDIVWHQGPDRPPLVIDCDECAMDGTDVCNDCIVTFLSAADDDGAVVVDIAEARALRMLHDGGLVPALRHQPRAASPP